MKKMILSLLLITVSVALRAQVPFFASTIGDGKFYGYTSLKFRPGINAQETYTTLQYGVGDYIAAGLDMYTSKGSTYVGYLLRAGTSISRWFKIGGQITPTFNLRDSMKFSYFTTALFMNGAISADGNLFWCSNTWYKIKDGKADTIDNWEYLGYTFTLSNGHHITPMAGTIHSWRFDRDLDIAAGVYYSVKRFNFYLWGNDFLQDHPRVVLGIDLTL